MALMPVSPALADTYHGIGYAYSLNDVRAMFPSASFEEVNAAWLKEGEKFYLITGTGIVGSIRIKFDDIRKVYSDLYQKEPRGTYQEKLYYFATSLADSQAYLVEWVRWSPGYALPVRNVIQKYGKKHQRHIDEQDFSVTYSWPDRSIDVDASDDGERVINVNFGFTQKERDAGYALRAKKVAQAFVEAGQPDIPSESPSPPTSE